MKKSLIVIFLFALVLLTACSEDKMDSKGETKNSLEVLKEKGEIVVGTEGTYAPFTFEENGKLTGFDVEITDEVFKRVGLKPKYQLSKWDGLIAGLDAKRWDVVANEVGINPERQAKYSFSDSYIASKAVIITAEKNDTIKSFADLKGKKVASSATSNYHKIAVDNGAEITVIDGFNQAIDLITSDRVDATLNDSVTYFDLKKKRPDLAVKVAYTEDDASESALLFRQGNEELIAAVNKALTEMKSDGTYQKISEKWFGTDVSK